MEAPVTLCRLLQHSIGQKIVVEFNDESAIEGIIFSCDNKALNLELEQAVIYRRRVKNLKSWKTEYCFVKGSSIRFIHFDSYPAVLSNLKRSLRKK